VLQNGLDIEDDGKAYYDYDFFGLSISSLAPGKKQVAFARQGG